MESERSELTEEYELLERIGIRYLSGAGLRGSERMRYDLADTAVYKQASARDSGVVCAYV